MANLTISGDTSGSVTLAAPAIAGSTVLTLPNSTGTLATTSQLSDAVPSGSVMPYAGSSAPSGWLLSDGSAVSRSTYAALFSAIGTTYGSGDGSTTFNLPDLRGRAPRGVDNMGGTAANRITAAGSGITGTTLGAAGGVESVTLTTSEIPSHNHTNQNINIIYGTGGSGGTLGTTVSAGGQSRSTSATSTISNTGSGNTHNNTGPTIMLNYIIKT